MSHDLDTVTDRLAHRRYGFPYPRNSLNWPWLRLHIALAWTQRSIVRGLREGWRGR